MTGSRSAWRSLAAALLMPTASALAQQARVLEVPSRFSTIQQALDSSRNGDTVLVAPGRYYENIRFGGKSVVLTSMFAKTRDPRIIERTIIDGSRPASRDSGSVVMIVDREDSTTVLQGFTITGGTGTVWYDLAGRRFFREGGGVLCELSAPTIQFNRIIGNEAVEPQREGLRSSGGGGIRCGYAEPTIQNNVVRGNRGRYGAGIVLFHSASTVRNNLIADNVGGDDFGGAGMWVVAGLSHRLATIIEYNTIVANTTVGSDSADGRVMRGKGGALLSTRTRLVFRHNVVWGNSQPAAAQLALFGDERTIDPTNIVERATRIGPAVAFRDTTRYEIARGAAASAGAHAGRRAGVFP